MPLTPERQARNAVAFELIEPLLKHYEEHKSGGKDNYETALTDLLADLMHYAKEQSISFGGCLFRAERHFDAEQAGA